MNKQNNSNATKNAGKAIFTVSIISIWNKITSLIPWVTTGHNWLWLLLGIIGFILLYLLVHIIWIKPWHIARINAKIDKASLKTSAKFDDRRAKKQAKKNKKNINSNEENTS